MVGDIIQRDAARWRLDLLAGSPSVLFTSRALGVIGIVKVWRLDISSDLQPQFWLVAKSLQNLDGVGAVGRSQAAACGRSRWWRRARCGVPPSETWRPLCAKGFATWRPRGSQEKRMYFIDDD